MRLPVTPYGVKTALVVAGAFVALAIVAAALAWPYGLILLAPALFVFYFFRNPERSPDDAGPKAIVSPADGKVVDIRDAEMPVLGGRAALVDIFLSIFDVHVNRAPLAGRVTDTLYQSGKFLNAMRGAAGDVNESNLILIEDERGKVVAVKQIAGVIARRIVCGVGKGDEVACGRPVGMIKFGSRTQVYIPEEMRFRPTVSIGDHVKAGKTVLGYIE